MSSLTLPVSAGQLPEGFCPTTYQQMLNGFSGVQTVTFPTTFSGVVTSATPPSDTTQVWLQLDSLGRPVRFYTFAQGSWLSLHPTVPGFIMIWPTALPDFTTFDGGDANAPGAASGPMWQQFTGLNAKFPIGAGTLPSTTVVPVGGTGGEEVHVLTVAELAAHTHIMPDSPGGGGTGGRTDYNVPPGVNQNFSTDSTGGSQGHNTLPPYLGVLYLQRSNRLFYAVA